MSGGTVYRFANSCAPSDTGGSVADATQYPESCIQGPTYREYFVAPSLCPEFTEASARSDRSGVGSEDCFKVNIYTPSTPAVTVHLDF